MNKRFTTILGIIISILLIGFGFYYFNRTELINLNDNKVDTIYYVPTYTTQTKSAEINIDPFSSKKLAFDITAHTDNLDPDNVKFNVETGLVYYDYPDPYSDTNLLQVFSLSDKLDLDANLWLINDSWYQDDYNVELLSLVKKYCELNVHKNGSEYWFDVTDERYNEYLLEEGYPEYHFGPFKLCPNNVQYVVFENESIVVANLSTTMDASDVKVLKNLEQSKMRLVD